MTAVIAALQVATSITALAPVVLGWRPIRALAPYGALVAVVTTTLTLVDHHFLAAAVSLVDVVLMVVWFFLAGSVLDRQEKEKRFNEGR